MPERHEPPPQSEFKLQLPSGALAHLPERHDAPPQSEFELHDEPGAVAHLPERQLTPGPQSEFELQLDPLCAAGATNKDSAAKKNEAWMDVRMNTSGLEEGYATLARRLPRRQHSTSARQPSPNKSLAAGR
ncbi:MAG: hypothetical protein JNJ46_17805 [Myxococcales bacterium]|nr:hypothetical protein [Myxococcales bacterium]